MYRDKISDITQENARKVGAPLCNEFGYPAKQFHLRIIQSVLGLLYCLAASACSDGSTGQPTEPQQQAVLEIISFTSGSDLDPDGYTVSVDGVETAIIGVSDTVRLSLSVAGSHDIELGGVNWNCGLLSPNPLTAATTLGSTTSVTFDVRCIETSGRLLFYTGRGGDEDLNLVNLDGTDFVQLTSDPAIEWQPDFSPDGSQVVFAGELDVESLDIYVMNLDGSGLRRLTSHPRDDGSPSWSADGSTIFFRSNRDLNEEIYSVGVDGSGLTRLTNSAEPEDDPESSPDGSLVLYTSRMNSNAINIFTMKPDGTDITQLTFGNESSSWDADWSPDGTQIVFQSHRDDSLEAEVYLMNADGSSVRRLTNNDVADEAPAWSPDGSRIAYSSGSTSNFQLFVTDVDGSVTIPVPTTAAVNYGVRWKP